MESAGTYTITRAGQVTIPSEARKELDLKEGSEVDFYYDHNMVVIRKKKTPLDVYEELAKETRERFKKEGVTRADVDLAVKEVRNEMRNSRH